MRVDLYTRVVLTVIAGCLLWISAVLTPWTSVSAAQFPAGSLQNPMRVVVQGWTRVNGSVTGSALTAAEIIPVSNPREPARVIVQGWGRASGGVTAAALTPNDRVPVDVVGSVRVAGGKLDDLPPPATREKK